MDLNLPNLTIIFFILVFSLIRVAEGITNKKTCITSMIKAAFYGVAVLLLAIQFNISSPVNASYNATYTPDQTNSINVGVIYITAFIAFTEFISLISEALERKLFPVQSGSSLNSVSPSLLSFISDYLLLNLVYAVIVFVSVFLACILVIWIKFKLLGT